MAEITWLGHACFLIKGRDVSVLMDPVPVDSGYDIGSPTVDIVTVSHDPDRDTALDHVQPGYRLINGPGEYEIKEVFITGVQTSRDDSNGERLGRNTVYVIEIDDVAIVHLGALGHVLTEKQVEAMSSVDVLIVPAGGGSTINASAAAEIIGKVEPVIVVPMQHRTERGDHERDAVDSFIKEIGIKEYTTLDRLTVRKSDTVEAPQTIVLNPV